MYFASRMQAGRLLAAKLVGKYRYKNCAVLALDDGGVVVGAQIASELHCILTLMLSATISLPQEPTEIAAITTSGQIAYNPAYSQSDIDEIIGENRGYVEQEKLHQMHEVNRLVTGLGTIDKRLVNGRNIIIVSDGLKSAFEVDMVYEFLKPIAIDKLIFAVPLASVKAVDRMHVLGDELICLDVLDDYRDTDHYYDKKDVPSHEKIIKTIEQMVDKWQ
jgi:putative phosphoribosyl transferase